MKFSEQDFLHGSWMLENRIDSASDLIGFWMTFGPNKMRYPNIERKTPWYQGLESEIGRKS